MFLAEMADFRAVGEALAIGLLIGGERYRTRKEGEKSFAGMRTFALFAVLGALSAVSGEALFAVVSFAGVVVMLALGYAREEGDSIGGTTEVAALVTFWLGWLVADHEALALATAVALVVVLASKELLHRFVAERVSDVEFLDTLKFLVVVLVVWPLLPDRGFGPYEAVNPAQIWGLVILVSSIGYVGYILTRALGGSRGLQVSALVGGLVSTTAVTMSLAQRAKEAPELARFLGVTGVLANSVQLPRLLVLVWVVDHALAEVLWLPLTGGFLAAVAGVALLAGRSGADEVPNAVLANPYSFLPALKFGLLLAAVFVASQVAGALFGESGVYGTAAVAGLADASAISLSVAAMVGEGILNARAAAWAVLIAVAVNAAVKCGLAASHGGRELGAWLAGGFVTMVGVAGVLLWLGVQLA